MEPLRWHCTSCGTRFEDDSGERCPKCLKRSAIVREERLAPPPPVYVAPEPLPEPPGSPTLVLAALPSVVAGLLMAGIVGFRVEPLIVIVACVGSAPLVGYLMTGNRASRGYAMVASMIASVGVVFGAAYAIRWGEPTGLVLGASMVVGVVPGLILFFAFRLLAQKPVVRIVLAFAAIVTTAFVVTSC